MNIIGKVDIDMNLLVIDTNRPNTDIHLTSNAIHTLNAWRNYDTNGVCPVSPSLQLQLQPPTATKGFR